MRTHLPQRRHVLELELALERNEYPSEAEEQVERLGLFCRRSKDVTEEEEERFLAGRSAFPSSFFVTKRDARVEERSGDIPR